MNKEAIERTKARCKKEIMDKDWTHVGLCFYVKKQKDTPELDETVDYEGIMLNGKKFFVSGISNNQKMTNENLKNDVLRGRAYNYTTGKEMDSYLQEAHPKAGEFIQMPNDWIPATGREALIAILLTLFTCAWVFTWLVLL